MIHKKIMLTHIEVFFDSHYLQREKMFRNFYEPI
jgi:hypothetical protein